MSVWAKVLDEIVKRENDPPPMVKALRLPGIDGWEVGRVWGRWDVDPDMYHGMGAVFGGYLAALADSFTSLAMLTTLADNEYFSTSDLRISFFRPVAGASIEIVAEVVHRGRRQAHVEAVFVDERNKVACKATATEVLLPVGEQSG